VSALDDLRRAALAAFADDVTWTQALTVLADAKRVTGEVERAARPARALKGCPSEAAYRRHLKAGEQCQTCRDFMRAVEEERRERHPEWWVRGAGVPRTRRRAS
jgi:hypothetical protein